MIEPDYLSIEEVLAIHQRQLALYGGSDGIRDIGVVHSALGQAQAIFHYLAGVDLYDIAAAYAYSISEGQPFVDGNKRVGLAAGLVFLDVNGAVLPRDDSGQLYDAMMAVAKGLMTRAGLADVFRRHV